MKLYSFFKAIFFGAAIVAPSLVAANTQQNNEHAVIIHFNYGSTNLKPIFELEEKLEKAINAAKVGEYDGNEVAVSGKDGYLYMYGPDANRLFEVVEPILKSIPFMQGAQVKKRYGPPKAGVKESISTISNSK